MQLLLPALQQQPLLQLLQLQLRSQLRSQRHLQRPGRARLMLHRNLQMQLRQVARGEHDAVTCLAEAPSAAAAEAEGQRLHHRGARRGLTAWRQTNPSVLPAAGDKAAEEVRREAVAVAVGRGRSGKAEAAPPAVRHHGHREARLVRKQLEALQARASIVESQTETHSALSSCLQQSGWSRQWLQEEVLLESRTMRCGQRRSRQRSAWRMFPAALPPCATATGCVRRAMLTTTSQSRSASVAL
mmetsp:Transcript_35043/g.76517  ORF Transcript_35043/g.76517 Transcript_35043/m.76517 type:complete len:243 (-) Transcript_35043:78-806(-)